MILNVHLCDNETVAKINSNSFYIRKVRIGHTQNKAEKIVEADNNQNFMELCLKRGLF